MKFRKPEVVGVLITPCIVKEESIMEPEEVLAQKKLEKVRCTYDCDECGVTYQDVLYPDDPLNSCYCPECRKIQRYSMSASNGAVVLHQCEDGAWVRYSEMKPLIDAARDIENGCSFPETDLQKAILKRLRPMIAILPK